MIVVYCFMGIIVGASIAFVMFEVMDEFKGKGKEIDYGEL